jgi:hypothetical protein
MRKNRIQLAVALAVLIALGGNILCSIPSYASTVAEPVKAPAADSASSEMRDLIESLDSDPQLCRRDPVAIALGTDLMPA